MCLFFHFSMLAFAKGGLSRLPCAFFYGKRSLSADETGSDDGPTEMQPCNSHGPK
jgi:hypothetical protein